MKAPRPLQSPSAQMPEHAGPKLIVDLDVAARVDLDPGLVEAEVVGVRPAPDREQHVRADHLAIARLAVDADADVAAARLERDALGRQAHRDAFGLEDLADRLGDVLVLAPDQARALLDHGDLAPKRRYICANSSPM